MFSNNEVTEGLLITVLCANFVLLFFIALHVAPAHLYFRQFRRLALAIVRKKDCEELINEMLSCSGEQQQSLRNDKVTAGKNLTSPATPDACSGEQQRYEVTGQSRQKPGAPDRVQKIP